MEIGSHSAGPRTGGQTACAGATVAIVEDHRQTCAAVEDTIEVRAQLFVANVADAEARIRGHDGLVELIRLAGKRIPHLRTMPGEIEQQHIAFARALQEMIFDCPENGAARRFLIRERHDVALVEIVEQAEHIL